MVNAINNEQLALYVQDRRWAMTRRGSQPVLILDKGEQWAMREDGSWEIEQYGEED
jgi:hypothetical protein